MLNLGEIRLIDIIYFSWNNVEREQMPYDIKPLFLYSSPQIECIDLTLTNWLTQTVVVL